LSVAAGVLASTPLSRWDLYQAVRAAPPVDETGPIGKKWVKLGGQSVVGAPTSPIITTPDGAAQYQTFEKGVIIYSIDWGAMLVSLGIFQKWLSLKDRVNSSGQNLLEYVGFPRQDYIPSSGIETGHFERGMIVVNTSSDTEYVVYGSIFEHYWHVSNILGLPTAEEIDATGGGRYQTFEGGDIYWRGDTGAWEVHGAILQRWLDLGGSGGILGYPLSDEEPVFQYFPSVEPGGEGVTLIIGRSSRFEQGVIYWSEATGAWEVMGKIREDYENLYGGSTGWLGFPTSGQGNTPTSGGVFNNFQRGVIVAHAEGPFVGIWAFNRLQLYIQRFEGEGTDTPALPDFNTRQDIYVWLGIVVSNGTLYSTRMPPLGEDPIDGSAEVNRTFDLTPGSLVIQSDLTIDITMLGWDEDSTSEWDNLGLIHVIYTIDNLWGLFDGGPHTVYGRDVGGEDPDAGFTATFGISSLLPVDPTQVRQQLFWSFENSGTPDLTYDQYASTFTDVDPNEFWLFHPFNRLYYELAYKHIAEGGNCLGMCLESIFAQVGRSLYSEPIIRFWPDTQDGQRLDPNNPTHQPMINELNIKQGYQLGAPFLDYVLGKFVQGHTHNPKRVFIESREAMQSGDYPIIVLTSEYFIGKAHAVRPYHWDDSDPSNWIIYVANPNYPAALAEDGDLPCRIEINPEANTFTYHHRWDRENNTPLETWRGSEWPGGHMLSVSFRYLSDQPRTPFWEILSLLTTAVFILIGDTGQTKQLTDSKGRSFYEPGLAAPPTRWDQIRRDAAARIPNFTRFIPSDIDKTGSTPEMYYARGYGATYHHEVLPAPGVAPGTVYEWVMNSATLSARMVIPGTPGIADRLTTHDLGTSTKAVTVAIPSNSVTKQISWTMAGPIRHRWIELAKLTLVPDQSITIRLANGGFDATIENRGSTTTAELRVQAGPGAIPVDVGTITLEGGTTFVFKFDTPLTTLSYTGGTPGNGEWLTSSVVITLTARDYSSKGIDYIEYSKDGANWTRYTDSFTYGDEGVTTLYFRSKDKDGNQEGANSRVFKIDTQPPQSTLTIGQPQAVGDPPVITPDTPLTLTAVDNGSGIQSVSYRFFMQGSTPPEYTTSSGNSVQFGLTGLKGLYEVHTFATDIAGNKEIPHIQLVNLDDPTALDEVDELPPPTSSDRVYLPLISR
jgi:hypothetical protein